MADQLIDARIYGARPLDPVEQQRGSPDPALDNYTAPQAVPTVEAVRQSPLIAEGAARIFADNNKVEASTLEGVGAAISQWSPKHAYEYFAAPKFDWVQGHNPVEMLSQVDFPLDKTQEKFLLETKSPDEFVHRLTNLREQNNAYKAMGEAGPVAFAAAMLDPGYLALDVAALGAGRAAKLAGMSGAMSRTVAGSIAAGGAYALGRMEQDQQAISDNLVFGNAMLNGAATAMFFRNGRLIEADPEFPGDQLNRLAREVEDSGAPAARTADDPDFVGPMPAHPSPEVQLTRPRVEPTGPAAPLDVSYAGGSTGGEYQAGWNLSRAEQAAMRSEGRVLEVDDVASIGRHADSVRSGRTVIDDNAKAVYLPDEDRVFLIRSNIKAGDDVKGILLHEVGVHMNAERVLGTARMAKMLDRLEDLAIAGNSRAKQAFDDVPANTPLHLVREEALGYYIERNHRVIKDSLVSKFVHGVKETLRRVGLRGLKLSENDIVQLVRKSAKSKAAGSFDQTFPYVWHGSPTRGINQLDTAYMGTGEGAQAYGWGHYLTSEKGTALDYRNKEALRRGKAPEDGGLYRVKINAAEHQFVNFDSKVQSATVQAAFDKLGVPAGLTGKQAYEHLARALKGQKAASEALVAEGVAGNKYATGRTRRSGEKNSNYVVFANDNVDMAARYSKGISTTSVDDAQKTVAQKLGQKLAWSLHKTLASFSPTAKKVADELVDNPLEMTGNSVVSQHRAIRADLQATQIKFENLLADHMASQGFGLLKRITSPRKALEAQRAIERDVYMEMLRRNRLSQDGMPITHVGIAPEVKAMADALDASSKQALAELKRSGVAGAAAITEHSGYVNRRWDIAKIEAIEGALMAGGLTMDAARLQMRDSMSVAIQRANGWPAELASDVAKAIMDRTRSKGYFEDSAFRRGLGDDGVAEIRNILNGSGITGSRQQRVLDVLQGASDEAGKASMLKHRVDMMLDEAIPLPDGTQRTLADMLDTNITGITERYLDNVASQAAFARKGYTHASDITKMRSDLLESIPTVAERERAANLFDNTVASLRGDPVGEDLPNFMRKSQAVTQMVGLARAGMFQFTEYSTAMAHYGALNTVRELAREMPFIRQIFSNPDEATHLNNVLSRNSSMDFRIRPFVNRLEDNFEVPVSDAVQMSLMQAKQLVPYLNALKYVQGHQARMVSNLVVNTFERGAKGDVRALAALEQYGLESHIMGRVRADINTHGMDTAKWSAATWDDVRAPLTKMMDDAVLRNRTGEIPAFAQFTSTGKFIFTFRSFVLGAHNKVLAGSLNRGGFQGLGLIMLYQMPLTYAVTQASHAMAGKPPMDDKQAVGAAFSQMGSLGLLSEAVGVALQNKQQFGAPGTIAWDRAYKLGAAVAAGDAGQAGAAAINSVPLLSVILPVKAIGENLKGK